MSNSTLSAGGPIGVFDGSSPLIEGNTLTDGPHIWGGYGDGAIIRDNTITGTHVRAIGVFDQASLTIEDNTIAHPGQDGLTLNSGNPTVTGNVIGAGSPMVEGNTIEGVTGRGVTVTLGAAPTFIGNTSCDNGENLFLAQGVDLALDESNEICADAPAG